MLRPVRAEYRLRLRSDNAATRLTPLGLAIGCVNDERKAWFVDRIAQRATIMGMLAGQSVRGTDGEKLTLFELIRTASLDYQGLLAQLRGLDGYCRAVVEEIIEDARYAPYLVRQDAEIRAMRANEAISLGGCLDYRTMAGLSNEMVEKLESARPATLGAAERIRGITPAALAVILVHAKRMAA